jgi:hypothetical protein
MGAHVRQQTAQLRTIGVGKRKDWLDDVSHQHITPLYRGVDHDTQFNRSRQVGTMLIPTIGADAQHQVTANQNTSEDAHRMSWAAQRLAR